MKLFLLILTFFISLTCFGPAQTNEALQDPSGSKEEIPILDQGNLPESSSED